MNLAPPISRPARGRDLGAARPARRTPARSTAKGRSGTLQRERHQPDYTILLAVVALAAIGILMVYSASAMRGYLSPANDTFAIVGPQIQWAILGIGAMLVTMRLDYRYLRLVSVPLFVVALVLLVLVLLPPMGPLEPKVVGGSARWLQIGPLPAVHPAEMAKLALIVYLAHWMAKRGTRIRSLLGGTMPFFIIVGPVVALIFKEPDLGTTIVVTLTALTLWFVAGANLFHLGVMASVGGIGALWVGLHGYQLERIRIWLDPWVDPLGAGYQTVQGLMALGVGGALGTGLGDSRVFVPNAFNDFIFAAIGQEFGFVGAGLVIALFLGLGYAGIRTALAAPDTFGALLAAGITAWLCIQAFINIGVVTTLIPITGITLPFISAGGSSLIICFAAVGILLSISRETVEKGTWNEDAAADRGRGHGRAHLPGARRRPSTARG